MAKFGSKVVAVLDTQSAFGVTIKQMRDNITTLQDNFSTLTGLAPGTLDTLQEIAGAIQDLQNRAGALETVQYPSDDHFNHAANLTNVVNPIRGSKVEVGNNVMVSPATGYALQVKGGLEMDNNAKITLGGGLVMRTSIPATPVDGDIYFDKTALALKIYVDDGNSQQWVQL
jgi:hypothetical protein